MVTPPKPFKAGPTRPYPKMFLKHMQERHPTHLSTNPEGWRYQFKLDFAPRGLTDEEWDRWVDKHGKEKVNY